MRKIQFITATEQTVKDNLNPDPPLTCVCYFVPGKKKSEKTHI